MNKRVLFPAMISATIFIWSLVGLVSAVEADAEPIRPCTMVTATGTAPCPPPIVSTDGSTIGGDANTAPVNMGELPRTGPDYTYEAPTYFDDETDEEPAEEPSDGEDEDAS
ncbi:hypothetical protein KNU14_gp77 [Gordonia phage Buggaboo]|uniref:Uncharacterized protein n=1 Tax=Gordonia phage Buggaboo TaxID=2315529 RepID=A0A386KEC0_9CAUD|nr:hypothetical protein KNU14_gp77 [Gordonia phage Buggaboo]AVE00729.1 hypothetical protein SEA_SUPERSULLEY_77 [Gordonia phage SuperSulley]AYD83269.1 hypothetical protein SEA_BUGGABOO_77 [Gordonia phage Buggaboo]QXN73384.1 hypothetical protein SEA_BONUM_79 [Gordonia phage Bonum]